MCISTNSVKILPGTIAYWFQNSDAWVSVHKWQFCETTDEDKKESCQGTQSCINNDWFGQGHNQVDQRTRTVIFNNFVHDRVYITNQWSDNRLLIKWFGNNIFSL